RTVAEKVDRALGLQRADRASDGAENTRLLARRYGVGRRWLGKQTSQARGMSGDDGHGLSQKTENTGVRERTPELYGAVVDDEFRRHAVGRVDDEVRRR